MRAKLDASIIDDMVSGVTSANSKEEGVITMKDDGLLVMVKGPEDVILFAMKVERDAMDEYDSGDLSKFGVDFDKIQKAMSSTKGKVELELQLDTPTGHKLIVSQEGFKSRLGLIDPNGVPGFTTNSPNVDFGVSFEGDLSKIKDFTQKVNNLMDADSFSVSAREDGVWLYSERDAEDSTLRIEWDDFEDNSVNWENCIRQKDTKTSKVDPIDDRAVESVFAVDFMNSIDFLSDEGVLYMDNQVPIKIVFDTPEGIQASYFITPRLPTDDSYVTTPDDVIERVRGE